MNKASLISNPPIRGHVVFLYESPADRMELVCKYMQEGLELNELCIYVTPCCEKQVTKNFKSVGFNPAKFIKKGSLKIFEMEETYLPDGDFVAKYMMENLINYLDAAESMGYSGLRTAGEMGWFTSYPQYLEDTAENAQVVDSWSSETDNSTGLYLYPVQNNFKQQFRSLIDSPTMLIYDKNIEHSPQPS
jgi:hypothetical protein